MQKTTPRRQKQDIRPKVRFRTVRIGRHRVCIPVVDTRAGVYALLTQRGGSPRPPAAATGRSAATGRMDWLTGRERKIVAFRFGLKDGYSRTLLETCKRFVMAPAEVRRIEQKMGNSKILIRLR